jgi:hypothetical protein
MKYLAMLLAAATMATCFACSPAVSPKAGFQSVASEQENKIIYLRRDGYVGSQYATLNHYLKVVKHFSRYDESGLFQVVVVFNNDRYEETRRNLNCDVQIVFLDADGLEVEKTNWQPYMFPSGQDVTIKQVSLSPDARDYKIYVREPRDADW